MLKIYRFYDAPVELQGLSDHGGDEEHVIVGQAKAYLDEILVERQMFDDVVQALDKWEGGTGTLHEVVVDGEPALVYITAHA